MIQRIPAMKNGRCNWPRGKVIGGSSVLNYMLYVRGNKKDYDQWEALGNPGWGYRDALYYFKKSEDNQNPYLAQTPYHGTGGYLTISEAPYHTPLVASFIEGGKQLGYENRDCNGEYQSGNLSILQQTHHIDAFHVLMHCRRQFVEHKNEKSATPTGMNLGPFIFK